MTSTPQNKAFQRIGLPRLGGRKLTICIAGTHIGTRRKLIVTAFDRRLTTFGGAHSSDGSAWKMRSLHNRWFCLLAGQVSEMTAIQNAVELAMRGASDINFRALARKCQKAYREERQKLIESEVLTDYDIDSYREYLNLKTSDRKFYDAISSEIETFDEGLNLIICGFDKNKNPHIFTIVGAGKIQYCDLQGCAVAGSGAWAAHVSLDRHPYNKWSSLGDCIYAVLAAKFSAEAADGVGRDTVLFVLSPFFTRREQASMLQKRHIDAYRDKWSALPHIPEGVAEELETEFRRVEMEITAQRRMKKIKS